MTVFKKTFAALALLASAGSVQAAEWDVSKWAPALGRGGLCQLSETGEAKRMEVRTASCAVDGSPARTEDCDTKAKPEETRWVDCRMAYSCTGWEEGVYAEGARDRTEEWKPARSTKVAAMVACANAIEADHDVVGCRSSKLERAVETLKVEPGAKMANANYAFITCATAVK